MSIAVCNICYIVGAGDNRATSFLPGEGDLVIAADGGLETLNRLGISPHLIIGDFDSLGYIPKEANVIRHPVRKDETDLMLACRAGLERGYTRFCIYGGLGGARLSHTVANLQTLRWLAEQGASGVLYGDACRVLLLDVGTKTFPAEAEGHLSLFAAGEEAVLTVKGASYEGENLRLTGSYPLGVSNSFRGREVTVTVTKGQVFIIWEKTS